MLSGIYFGVDSSNLSNTWLETVGPGTHYITLVCYVDIGADTVTLSQGTVTVVATAATSSS